MDWPPEVLLIYRASDNFQGAALVAQDNNLLRFPLSLGRLGTWKQSGARPK